MSLPDEESKTKTKDVSKAMKDENTMCTSSSNTKAIDKPKNIGQKSTDEMIKNETGFTRAQTRNNPNNLFATENMKELPANVIVILKKYFDEGTQTKIKYLLQYNLQGGKNSRSKIFRILLKSLNGKESPLLMFIIELLQASFIIYDDIMDNSLMRRGIKCWYLQKDMTAVADGMLIINLIYKIILDAEIDLFCDCINTADKQNKNDKVKVLEHKTSCNSNLHENTSDKMKTHRNWMKKNHEPNLALAGLQEHKEELIDGGCGHKNVETDSAIIKQKLAEFVYDVILKTCMGQTQDCLKKPTKTQEDIRNHITLRNYKQICEGKNGYYTFYFPLKLAFICAKLEEPKNLENACNAMGLLHQMRDDYLNFYPNQTGKTGNDLEERKMTYFVCKLVEDDENLVNFFAGKDIENTRSKIQKYLDSFDKDQGKIVEEINSYKDEQTKEIIDLCIDFLTKRSK